ncbi:hypothetical protein [Streptomyces sp. CB02400]|uniref:hypothetical protein n=1 Tax=Streptomyces sp. CB02400 TaxID=1703944 RepID=UPI000959E572|nr:hypothetical protein [Streptomyces sp. CB02400]OKJ99182.1 hypothetical protein AMK33_28610 [Streptomyces sp. CB02400]
MTPLIVLKSAWARELMMRIGHSSYRVALVYQHMTSDRDRAIVDRLEVMIQSGGGAASGLSGEGVGRP